MPPISDIIKYYRDCYQKDYKGLSIGHFLSRAVTHTHVPDTMECLWDTFIKHPVDIKWGQTVDQELAIHSKEKDLMVGAFFLKGKITELGKSKTAFAPLFIYKASLEEDDGLYFLNIVDRPSINPVFLDVVRVHEGTGRQYTQSELMDKVPIEGSRFEHLVALEKFFSDYLPHIDVDRLGGLIKGHSDNLDLIKISKSRSHKYIDSLIPGVAYGIVKKPTGSRGIIDELTTLSTRSIRSNLLHNIFGESQEAAVSSSERQIEVPVSLSNSQKEVFYSFDAYPITLVIGPPGTGKSFTIAAMAAELIRDGMSVLVASKNSQASNVIAAKMDKDMGLKGLFIKCTNKVYRRSLRAKLQRIVDGIESHNISKLVILGREAELRSINKDIRKKTDMLLKKEAEEISWGRFFYEHQGNFFSDFRQKWIEYRKSRSRPIWKIKKELDVLERRRTKLLKRQIEERYHYDLYKLLSRKRRQVNRLIAALDETAGNLIQKRFADIDFRLVFTAIPAWMCNASDISQVLPLEEEIFDVVIIDEASQCDIASAIPLLYRAKKAIIVGDPHQLRHISFLSGQLQKTIRQTYLLGDTIPDYRSKSILDAVNTTITNQDQVILLDEHYRSAPDIIDFSNQQFYAGRLKVMTFSPTSMLGQKVALRSVPGRRAKKGDNILEAEKIIAYITSVIQEEESIDRSLCESIGVISPFRAQVTLLKSLLRQSLTTEMIKKHRILIGTPYHFQGEERDVVFLSFVVDDNVHPSTLNYLNKSDVFNVSITRARNRQVVYTSLDHSRLDGKYLLSQYLNSIGTLPGVDQIDMEDIHDHFAIEIVTLLKSWKVDKILRSFPVSGVVIDIVAVYRQKTYCIDLIGYPGVFAEQFTPEKMRMLDRMGHPVFYLPYSNWYLSRDTSICQLRRFIGVVDEVEVDGHQTS